MKSVKELAEDVDGLKNEALALNETAKRLGRELNPQEVARFDEITDKKTGLLAVAQKNLDEAEERERVVLELSARNRRQAALDEIQTSIAGGYTGPRSERLQLPTNGQPQGEGGLLPARPLHRMAKLKAFKDDATAFDCGMWLRAVVGREYNRNDQQAEVYCQRKGLTVTNAGNESSGGSGGYLVPTPLSQTIIDVREAVGVARQILSIQPMTSDTMSFARRSGGLSVNYTGETVSISTSDKTWTQIELIAKKRTVAHQISQELQDDALISVVDDAVNEMAYALADKEDAEAILGDGTATYGGVMGLVPSLTQTGTFGISTAATGHDTWAELDLADFTAAMGLLPEKYSRAPVWVCSANFYWSAMVKVQASGGGNAIANLQDGPSQPKFLGFPVYFTDKMPRSTATATVSALFGTFSLGGILGDRTGLRVGRSDEYAFLSDMTTLKATSRYDIRIHAPGTDAVAGAYVGLKTAS